VIFQQYSTVISIKQLTFQKFPQACPQYSSSLTVENVHITASVHNA